MITDAKKREVARQLRELAAENPGTIGSMRRMQTILDDGKRITGTAHLPTVAAVLERYADLIDRPTCRAVQPCPGAFYECSACGYDSWVDAESVTNYCPNCGAEVV